MMIHLYVLKDVINPRVVAMKITYIVDQEPVIMVMVALNVSKAISKKTTIINVLIVNQHLDQVAAIVQIILAVLNANKDFNAITTQIVDCTIV